MKNKPNSFFDNRGFPNWGGGGGGRSAAWEFFPHNPVFFSDNTLIQLSRFIVNRLSAVCSEQRFAVVDCI